MLLFNFFHLICGRLLTNRAQINIIIGTQKARLRRTLTVPVFGETGDQRVIGSDAGNIGRYGLVSRLQSKSRLGLVPGSAFFFYLRTSVAVRRKYKGPPGFRTSGPENSRKNV